MGEKSSSGGQDPEEDDADGMGTRTAGWKSRGSTVAKGEGHAPKARSLVPNAARKDSRTHSLGQQRRR